MTVRGKLEGMLVAQGMFASQAQKVMDLAIPELNKLSPDYAISFDRPADEYPTTLYSVWYASVRPVALKWIDENQPLAWYRDVFIDTMTKAQAIQALKEGKKLTHRYFSATEFVFQPDPEKNIYQFEDGVQLSSTMFWLDRAIEQWDTDWEIIN